MKRYTYSYELARMKEDQFGKYYLVADVEREMVPRPKEVLTAYENPTKSKEIS